MSEEYKDLEIEFIKTTSSNFEDALSRHPVSIIHVHDPYDSDYDYDSDYISDASEFDHADGDDRLYVGGTLVTDRFNVGKLSDDIVTKKVEGLESSTIGELKRKTMSQIILDMICPLTNPTHTNPSITLSYTSTLIKVGTVLPEKSSIGVSSNSGTWTDGSAYYGPCGEVSLTMTPDKWGEVSEEGTYTISGSGEFGKGEMSKDSHGGDYQQATGGTVTSNTITIKAVQPILINNSVITTMTEQKLIDYTIEQTIYDVTIPAEKDGTLDKFKVYLPSVFSKFEVKQYNSVSGKYDIDITMELMDGETSKYIRTKDTLNTNTSVAKYEIKLKK